MGAAIFLILAFSLQDIVLGFIGVFTVYAALSDFKLHGISYELKSQGVKATSVDDLIENESSLQVVIDKIQASYPKLFSPKMSYRAIFNQLTVIVDTIKFMPAKLLPKIILLVTYLILVSLSVLVTFFIIAANYKEIPRIDEVDGKKYVYSEHHFFGQKRSECPTDADLYYDGKGTGFEADGSISDVFYYTNGYRTGEWLSFDKAGNIIERKNYDRGRLSSFSKPEDGTWKTYSFEDMSFLRKCSEEIQRLSQPRKSNHGYF